MSVLEKKYGDLLDHPQEFKDIQERVEDITCLVNDLTLMTELDEVNYWAMDVFDYYPIIRGFIEGYDETNTHQVSVQSECDVHFIFANPRLFTIALRQVLDNAVTFTPNGGAICIFLRQQGAYHLIEVVDEGIGMAPDTLAQATHRFYRMDDAHTKRGFGLGLSMVKRICEIHSSRLIIESTLSEGTRVVLRFVAGDASRL
ncbi:MAG: sensor histidine kinase [Anaerolineae bacterium]